MSLTVDPGLRYAPPGLQRKSMMREVHMRRLMLACVMVLLSVAGASAQSWPSRPIRAVVPLTPGAATDIMARAVLEQVSAQLGQPIVVENRPGAGNTIGMAAVAKADPDGYTILVNSSTHTVSPA